MNEQKRNHDDDDDDGKNGNDETKHNAEDIICNIFNLQ